ncbi:MAG: hypothetical protein AABW86_05265 [Candidatus Micrarchaeota archaeon]
MAYCTKERLLAPDVILKYPPGIDAKRLAHRYTEERLGRDGKQINFSAAVLLLDTARENMESWFETKTWKSFQQERFRLGTMAEEVREQFYSDSRMQDAMGLLGMDPAQRTGIKVPWWNELAANEIGHEIKDGAPFVVLGPRHSYETQLVRSGIQIGITSVSVGGIVRTVDGFIVVGIRGGSSYPNTFHINAGALGLTRGIIDGSSSIYDFYLAKELEAELGIQQNEIYAATIHARIFDRIIENGPMYIFYIRTRLSLQELQERHRREVGEDSGEHTRFIGLRNNKMVVWSFLAENYRGNVENRQERPDSERRLLHPGALALLSTTTFPILVLENLYREGNW